MKVSKKRLEKFIQAWDKATEDCSFCPARRYCITKDELFCPEILTNWLKKEDKKGETKQ